MYKQQIITHKQDANHKVNDLKCATIARIAIAN